MPSVLIPIQTIINQYSIAANVEFKNHLKNDELKLLLETCTMAIINKPYTFQNHYNFSTKLGEYFGYGIPVITTSYGEAERYLKQEYNCIIVKPNDEKGIANAIKQLRDDPALADRLGKNALLTAKENFDYRLHSSRLALFIKDVLSGRKSN